MPSLTIPEKRLKFAVGLVVVLAAGIALAVWRSEYVSMMGVALALATGVLALIPSVIHLLRDGPPHSLVLPLTGLYYLIFYALPVFIFDPRHWYSGRDEAGIEYGMRVEAISEEAQLVLFLGLAAFISTYYSSVPLFRNRVPHLVLPRVPNSLRLRVLLWLLLVAHLAYAILPALKEIPSIGQFFLPAGPFAAGMLLLSCREARSWFEMLGVLSIVALLLAQTVATGLLTNLVLFCGFLAVVLYYARSRWCWLFAVLPFAVIIALYSPLTQSRPALFSSPSGFSLAHPLGVFGVARKVEDAKRVFKIGQIAIDYWSQHDGKLGNRFAPLIHRISRIVLLSHVVEKTPEEVPFMGGASYSPLVTSFIPRLLWRDKPKEQFGQTFGHRYRIIWPSDRRTSVNIPWVVEMYVNFGIPGAILGMAIIGALLAFLVGVFNNLAMSTLEFVTGTAVIYWLAYPDSNLSLMTGSLLPLAICLWLYFRVGLTVGNRIASG